MTKEIDDVVMKWKLAALFGTEEDAAEYAAQYMKLALELAMKK